MALPMACAATASAQDPGNTTSQYDPNAASQLPEGFDPSALDARYHNGAASQKPADYNPDSNVELSAEM